MTYAGHGHVSTQPLDRFVIVRMSVIGINFGSV